jgi:hypothetical protein
MNKQLSPLLLFLLYAVSFKFGNAQSIANYATVRTTGITYSSISSTGNAIDSWRNNTVLMQDDNRSNQTDIGFDFWYNGTRYTKFSVSTNGYVDFSSSTADGGPYATPYGYDNTQFTGNGSGTWLALAPFYDDMTAQGGVDALGNSIKYLVTGSAPNRVLTIEWINMAVYLNTTPSLNFQVKLYETTGVIEFVYGTMTQGTANFTYTCGINAATLANTPTAAQLKCQQTANSNTFNNTEQNALTAMPANNSKITFTPPATTPASPSGTLTFTGVSQTGMTVNWTNWCTNELGYVLYNSTDNVNFDFVTQTAVNATSYVATGLLPGTTYYWRMYAVTEGYLSAAVSGNQATNAAGNVISITTGNWNQTTTWNCGCIPSLADNVTIANGHTVSINVNANANSLTVGQGTSGTLRFTGGTNLTLNVSTNLTVSTGATFNIANNAAHTLNLGGNLANNGSLDFRFNANRTCDVNFTKNGNATLSGTGATNQYNLIRLNMGSSINNTLDVTASNFTVQPDFLVLNTGTFKLSTLNAVTITPFSGLATINNSSGIHINSATATVNFGNTIDLYGNLLVSNGTVNIGNAQNENVASNGGVFQIFGGNVNIAGQYYSANINTLAKFTISGGTLTLPTSGCTSTTIAPFHIDGAGSTFNMSGGTIVIQREGGTGAQDLGYTAINITNSAVTGGTLQIGNASTPAAQIMNINTTARVGNLLINSANATGRLTTNPLTVTSNVTIATGVLNANNLNLTLGGTWTNNATFTPGTGTVIFNGSAAQTLTGSVVTTFNNLTISNTSGSGVTLGLNTNVSGTLNFTSGVITTGANRVIINAGGTVTGAGTGKFVNGFLQKNVATGTNVSRIFEVGFGTSDYLPVTTLFANVSVAGNLTAKVFNGDHPNIATSCIDDLRSVNRYWQLTNAGITFTNYSATCNFIGVGSDADAGSTPANYFMSLYNGSTWTMLTQGATGATSNQATGITVIGQLQIGEKRGPSITTQPSSITVCNGNPAVFSVVASGSGLTYQWQINTGSGFTNLTNGGIYSGVTTATLNISACTTGMNGYLYRCVVSSSICGGSTNSNSATLTVNAATGASITITASPSNNICAGTNVTFTATVVNGGATPTYQWKLNGTNVGTSSTTYSNSSLANGDMVQCVLTSSASCVPGPVTSNSITMTVNPIVTASISISASPSGSICSGTVVNFSASTTNGGLTPTFQWQVNGGNVGTNSPSYTNSSLVNGDVVRCILTSSASCVTGSPATSNTITATVSPSGTWLGTTSTNWNTATNWCGGVPTTTTNVTIGTGTPFMPQLTANATTRNISIASGVIVDLNNNTLSVSGAFSGTGTLKGSASSSLDIQTGTGSPGTFYMDQTSAGSSNVLATISLNRSGTTTTVGNVLNVTNTVTVTAGTLASGGNITLVSDATRTARVASLATGADITGNVTMQRYIPAGTDGWMFLCAPVSGATLQQWDDDFITGGFPGSAFPPPTVTNASIVGYDETLPGTYDDGYVDPTNMTNPIVPRRGYWAYIMNTPLTVDVTGPLLKFNQNFGVTYTNDVTQPASENGWNLLANPYPSTIDWDGPGWTKTNVADAVYMYNPTLDQYTSYVGGIGINGGSNLIASSQAFLVQTVGNSPVLQLTESGKNTADGIFIRSSSVATDDILKLNLNGLTYSDETVIRFNSAATTDFDLNLDALKFYSFTSDVPAITSLMDTTKYSINALPLLTNDISLPIKVRVGISGTYTISLDSISRIPAGSCLILHDLKTGIQTDLRTTPTYTFTITDTTYYPRFRLNIGKPVQVSSVAANCSNNGSATATGNGAGPFTYVWTDSQGSVLQTHTGVGGSDVLTNLGAGEYFVTVSGNSGYCSTASTSVIIESNDAITADVNINAASCSNSADGSIQINSISGGVSPYTVFWSNGEVALINDSLVQGNYILSITDSVGCVQNITYAVATNSSLSAGFTMSTDTVYLLSNSPVVFTNTSAGGLTYVWDFGDGSAPDNSQNPLYVYKFEGTYTVTLIVSDGTCTDTVTQTIVVINAASPTGVIEAVLANQIHVFSDNTNQTLVLTFNFTTTEKVKIQILNSLGQRVVSDREEYVQKSKVLFDFTDKSKGVYYVSIQVGKELIMRKVVVN